MKRNRRISQAALTYRPVSSCLRSDAQTRAQLHKQAGLTHSNVVYYSHAKQYTCDIDINRNDNAIYCKLCTFIIVYFNINVNDFKHKHIMSCSFSRQDQTSAVYDKLIGGLRLSVKMVKCYHGCWTTKISRLTEALI